MAVYQQILALKLEKNKWRNNNGKKCTKNTRTNQN